MQIEEVLITSIAPYERNNKIHDAADIEKLAKSITEFGWTQPIAVDEAGVILAGHRRYAAAQSLGLEMVPVVRLTNLTEAQKKHYRIADNKLAAEPVWDFENLRMELEELSVEEVDISFFDLDSILPVGQRDKTSSGDLDAQNKKSAPHVNYLLVFEDEAQQKEWYDFLRYLKNKYVDIETTAERVLKFVREAANGVQG